MHSDFSLNIHKPDDQNEWDYNTHTHTSSSDHVVVVILLIIVLLEMYYLSQISVTFNSIIS